MKFGKFYQDTKYGFIFQPFKGNEPFFNLVKNGYFSHAHLNEVVNEAMGYITMDATIVNSKE